ncbi:MAG: DegV family protein [Defluviitaleaceae bacterium]|nr:DegV family protein [Defluviitaleaceae bacterium]
MFQIISDGGCDFSTAETQAFNVQVVPFYISFDGNTHLKEGIDITREEYFSRLASDKKLFPKTAQPSPQDYIDAYTPHLKAGRDILSVTISSKLSGSHNSAVLAANMLRDEFPQRRLVVLDSQSASIGQGLILKEIAKMKKAGFSLEKTADLAERVLKTTRVYFTLDSLEYLRRGGRVGPTTAFVGGILGLRPILHLEDGQVSHLDNVRGKKNAMRLISEALTHTLRDDAQNVNICIGHILKEDDAVIFKYDTETSLGITIDNEVAEIGAAIGTHTGPGGLAFAYCKKFESIVRQENRGHIQPAAHSLEAESA